MIVDESGGEKIQPQGLKDYIFKSKLCDAGYIAFIFQC